MKVSAQQIAALIHGEIEGDPNKTVSNFAKIEEAGENDLSFIANPKYTQYAAASKAGILLVSKSFSENTKATLIKVEDPYSCLAVLLGHFQPKESSRSGREPNCFVHDTAQIDASAYIGSFSYIGKDVCIGKNVRIYPQVYLGDGVVIGDNVTVFPQVSIYHGTEIGADSIIHSGCVIGSDGFGFAPNADGSFKKIPQTGKVLIGKRVEIGANTVIDRATLGATLIQDGVKLDNLIQIAHNVEIGENTVIAAQSGVSGSTKLGKNVMVGGQVGIVGHIRIADGVKINAQSGVSKSVTETSKALTGSPAYEFREAYKHQVLIRKLPELMKRIEELEQLLGKSQK